MNQIPNDITTAKFLGYFSLGLGLLELVAARRLRNTLGLPVPSAVIRGFGAREVAAGLGVLTYPDNPAPMWSRVGGDVLDVAVLASGISRANPNRGVALGALAAVLAITALDVAVATALQQRKGRALRTAQRTRIKHNPAA